MPSSPASERRIAREGTKPASVNRGKAAPGAEDLVEVVCPESGATKQVTISPAFRVVASESPARGDDGGGQSPEASEPSESIFPIVGPVIVARKSPAHSDDSSRSSKTSESSLLSAITEYLVEDGTVDSESIVDCIFPSLSLVSKSELPVKEALPVVGPKYYIAADTKTGQARVIHEAMPWDLANFQNAEEKGFEVLECNLAMKRCEEQPSSKLAILDASKLDMLCECGREEDDNSLADELASLIAGLADEPIGNACAASGDALESGCADAPLETGCTLASAGGCAGLVVCVLFH